jgi:molybdenum cofactor cytidylyltransferase
MNNARLSVLIPAAGASTRLGQSKQLVNYRGKPLLQHVIDVVSSTNPSQIIVVTGADADTIREKIQAPDVRWVHNPHWQNGLGDSIAQGARSVDPQSSGLMIMLCDQYRVTEADLRKLVETWRANQARIVAAKAGERCMPPLIFPSDMFNNLEKLTGETGARSLVARHPGQVTAVSMENAAIDLDTHEQLQNL